MNSPFRISNKPLRTTISQQYSDYQKYRDNLRKDFHHRCGYCDVCEISEGENNFEIDHFIPIRINPQLKCEYSNLIYSCRLCNRTKSGKEISLEPTSEEYEKHFNRLKTGKIIPITDEGVNVWKKLKFYLLRRKYSWQISKLIYLREKLLSYENRLLPTEIILLHKIDDAYKELNSYIGELMITRNISGKNPSYILTE